MTPQVIGCSSAIGARLWTAGRILPALVARASLIEPHAISSFADFQRRLRVPVRLACFVAGRMGLEGSIFARNETGVSPPARAAIERLGPGTYSRALAAVNLASGSRAEPALIYGQRFLTPESAVCRAALVLERLSGKHSSSVLFMGDDDLSSVAFGVIAPKHRVSVIDIDPKVLEPIVDFGRAHGLQIDTLCGDIAADIPARWSNAFDAIVGDPYPSADHSFERFFCDAARRLLNPTPDAFALLTVGPSHKPPGFAGTLLIALQESGWRVGHISPDVAEYQLIPGELTQLESDYLSLGDASSEVISHTKSYVVLHQSSDPALRCGSFDVASWLSSLPQHDLVARMGGRHRIDEELSSRRSPWKAVTQNAPLTFRGIDLKPLLFDLLGDLASATQLAELAQNCQATEFRNEFARACAGMPEADRLVGEAAVLLEASLEGSRRQYTRDSVEAEHYLLARIYESYWRAEIIEEHGV